MALSIFPSGYTTSFDAGVSQISSVAGLPVRTPGVLLPFATIPATPTAPSATVDNTQSTVSWAAPANGGTPITGYYVQAYLSGSPDGSPLSAGLSTSVLIVGLTNGSSYTFKVQAQNVVGVSAYSAASTAVVPATTPGTPAQPTAVAGSASATVTWTTPSSDGSSAITGYDIQPYISGSSSGSPTSVGVVLSTSVTGLTNGTAYTFAVRAKNAIGNGSYSSQSTAVTPASVALAYAVVPGSAVPLATVYSTNLASWTSSPTPPLSTPQWYGGASSGSRYVITPSNNGATSWTTDGISWTAGGALPLTTVQWKVTYGLNLFVAVGLLATPGAAAYSTDGGVTWTAGTNRPISCSAVGFGASTFVAIGNANGAYSTDGITWTRFTAGTPTAAGQNTIVYGSGPGKFVSIGNTTTATYWSADGQSWTLGTGFPSGQVWTCLAYGNSTYFAATQSTVGMTSTNGTSWTQVTIPTGAWVACVYRNSQFVLLGNKNGTNLLATSSTGATGSWTVGTTPGAGNWNLLLA